MKPILAFVACMLAAGLAQAADGSPIAIEKFFGKTDVTGAAISPNGRHVLLRMQSRAGRSMLNVVDAETHQQKAIANFGNADVGTFFWQSDTRVGYTVINVDHGGDVGSPGLYAVDRDGGGFTPLSITIEKQRSFADPGPAKSSDLAAPTLNGFRYRKSEAMFVLARSNGDTSLARIDMRSKRITDVRAPRKTWRWLIDPEGEVRIAVTRRDGVDTVFYHDGGWRELATFSPTAPEAFEPLLFADGTLYVRARNGNNESSIYRYDLEKNAMEASPMISVPGFDANGYFVLNDRKMLGFRVDTDAENTTWFDPAMKAMQEEVDALLPATINTISYGERSETPYVLIDAHSDLQDHVYLLYNRDTRDLLQLGATHPDLSAGQMAPMRMERFTARDGLPIPLYLTIPANAAKKALPTVVLIGDPQWRRSANGAWNDEVQFLASRGYAVLQPQARGTRGFGAAHEKAGAKQWGLAIQDDIADAVKWSVAAGHTDPSRVCIAGAGYGGYAAMMGLIRDPALFKCGISWSGITDIGSMFALHWRDSAEPSAVSQLRETIGDPKLDEEQFKATSPLYNAARITQPVLLAYGKDDSRVPFSAGRKFYQALSATNSRVEWLEYTPSVEDWKTQGNRIDLWRHIEAFLARNIGATTPGS